MRLMLTLSDREEISRGLADGLLYKEIELRMGRDASVVSREVTRHGGRVGYRAAAARHERRDGPAPAEAVRGRAVAVAARRGP